jgi:hypothetical protein
VQITGPTRDQLIDTPSVTVSDVRERLRLGPCSQVGTGAHHRHALFASKALPVRPKSDLVDT